MTILGFEMEAAKAFFVMAMTNASGANAQQQQTNTVKRELECVRAVIDTVLSPRVTPSLSSFIFSLFKTSSFRWRSR